MKTKTVVLSGAAALVVAAGIAFATPIVGLLSPLLSVGTNNHDLEARGSALTSTGERFHVELETEGPSTVSIQEGAYAAGGANGWHSHPGMVLVTIISGSIILRWTIWRPHSSSPSTRTETTRIGACT